MNKIDNDNWQFQTTSIEHKQAMLDLAKSCGVPTPHPCLGYHDDEDPYLSWFGQTIGIGSLPKRHEYRTTEIVTQHEFEQACFAYQAERAAKRQLVTA